MLLNTSLFTGAITPTIPSCTLNYIIIVITTCFYLLLVRKCKKSKLIKKSIELSFKITIATLIALSLTSAFFKKNYLENIYIIAIPLGMLLVISFIFILLKLKLIKDEN